MEKTGIILVGLPGDMGTRICDLVRGSDDFELAKPYNNSPIALTGTRIKDRIIDHLFMDDYFTREGISLFLPQDHESALEALKDTEAYKKEGNLLGINFATAEGYDVNFLLAKYGIPFISGTTGVPQEKVTRLKEAVRNSDICAILAPNMAAPIVALQEFIQDFANRNPGKMKGYTLGIEESHQATKKDTSGTAKAMVEYFNKLGVDFTPEQIKMIRNTNEQREIGVPEQFLSGHGWHAYSLAAPASATETKILDQLKKEFGLFFTGNPVFEGYEIQRGTLAWGATSPDGNVLVKAHDLGRSKLGFTHNINGRSVYADGAITAAKFLPQKMIEGEKGKVYTMIDVLKGA